MDEIEAVFNRKDMTFEEAVKYFKERVPVSASVFYRIAEKYRGLAFTVGGYPLQYPGERGAPPALVINCRCTMVGTRWRARGSFPQGRGLVP